MPKIIFLILVTFSVAISTKGLESDSPEQLVKSYFQAFNSGDVGLMRAYFEMNFSDSKNIDERLRQYENIKKNVGTVHVEEVKIVSKTEAHVIARASNGEWLFYTFQLEQEPPRRIVQIRVNAEDQRPDFPARRTDDEELASALQKYLETLVKDDEFSGVVLVANGAKTIFEKAYGMANLSCKSANGIGTKFNLGSINKIFTRIAIGQLLEQKQLGLDDKVAKHYPDYPNRDLANRVTIRHLIDMTSGMGDIFNEKFDATPKEQFRSLKDYLPLFLNDPLQFEPGSRKQYSNAGYVLLGLLIEKITGQDYYEYVEKNIFQPAGMTNSAWYASDDVVENMAEGYTREGCDLDGKPCRKQNIFIHPARGSSAGGGYSTARDLISFADALRTNKLLPSTNPLAVRDMAIAGGAPGTSALLDLSDNNYTVVVLSNYDPPIAGRIGKQIRAWLPQPPAGK